MLLTFGVSVVNFNGHLLLDHSHSNRISLGNFLVCFKDQNFLSSASISSATGHICSGVILIDGWIITTAKCVSHYTADELTVSYGSRNRNEPSRVVESVDDIVIHPKYKEKYLLNNVALIKTKFNIQFNEAVQPAI